MRLAPKAAQRVESFSTLEASMEASFLCFQITMFVFVPSYIRVIDILHLHCSWQRLVEEAHPKQCKCRMSIRNLLFGTDLI